MFRTTVLIRILVVVLIRILTWEGVRSRSLMRVSWTLLRRRCYWSHAFWWHGWHSLLLLLEMIPDIRHELERSHRRGLKQSLGIGREDGGPKVLAGLSFGTKVKARA